MSDEKGWEATDGHVVFESDGPDRGLLVGKVTSVCLGRPYSVGDMVAADTSVLYELDGLFVVPESAVVAHRKA